MYDPQVYITQQWLNAQYRTNAQWNLVAEDGQTGWGTIFGLTRALQIELGITTLSDTFGPTTAARFASQIGAVGSTTVNKNVVKIAQGALWCKGYTGGFSRGTYDADMQGGIATLTGDMGLQVVYTINTKVLKALLTMDAYKLIGAGTASKQAVQRWLNGTYVGRADFAILPCDGLFSRNTQQGLMYAIQYESGMADGVANGNFGPGTKAALQTQAYVSLGTVDGTKKWVRLFQGALRFNDYIPPFDGSFATVTRTATQQFQSYAALSQSGAGDYQTWASLLISTGDESRSASASDMATQLTPALCNALYGSGYRTVGRYLTVSSKRYSPGELQAIFSAGLRTFPIMQEANTGVGDFTQARGLDHGFQAARRLRQLGFKSNTTVFFAVDFDATDDDVTNAVIPYFRGVQTKLAATNISYNIGVYGTRNVCSRVINAGLASEAFIASMSWGWSGNLGYKLPPSWSYDQIQTITLSGTSMPIDRDVQSTLAAPSGSGDVLATPLVSGAYDSFYWMMTHATVLAETVGYSTAPRDQATAVLYYVQSKDPSYLKQPFPTYLTSPAAPPSGSFDLYVSFPSIANGAESASSETQFVQSYPVVGGTPVTTPHMAVTARGYLQYGRPTSLNVASVADLGGWVLDLASLWASFSSDTSVPRPATALDVSNWFKRRLAVRDPNQATQGVFSFDDFVGDIDGYLIGSRLADNSNRLLDDVVREVRANIAANDKWRFQAFYSERFNSSLSTAKQACADALNSSNFLVGGAVSYILGGFAFPLWYNSAGSPAAPTSTEIDIVSGIWSDLVFRAARDGAGAAPAP